MAGGLSQKRPNPAAPDPEHPWDRRRHEPSARHTAFRVYLDLGPDRDVAAAYTVYAARHRPPGTGTRLTEKEFRTAARLWRWKSRADRHDDWVNAKREEAAVKAAQAQGFRWGHRLSEAYEDGWKTGTDLFKKGRELLGLDDGGAAQGEVEVGGVGVQPMRLEDVRTSDLGMRLVEAGHAMRLEAAHKAVQLASASEGASGQAAVTQQTIDKLREELAERWRAEQAETAAWTSSRPQLTPPTSSTSSA